LGLSALKLVMVAFLSICLVGACMGFGVLKGMLDSAPDIDSVDVTPTGFRTTVFDADGNAIQTLVKAGANREIVELEEIPEDVINAFIAIEDARYWTHNGIDLMGVVRAFVLGIAEGEFNSGASTITQQLIKNNVFGGGAERNFGDKLERKVQEWYLAIELDKRMSKEEVLENYLNTINLGHSTLGIQAASLRYFGKHVSELTMSEGTVIAATTSSPGDYDPINEPVANARRRRIVLDYMVEQGYISEAEKEEALADNVYERIEAFNLAYLEENEGDVYSSFVDSLIDQVLWDLQKELGLTRSQASDMLYGGGLRIYSTQDPSMQLIVDEEVSNPENYPIEKYGLSYALSVQGPEEDDEAVHYSEGHVKLYLQEQTGESRKLIFNTREEVEAAVQGFKESILQEGDKILGEKIDITLQPQLSFVLMDQETGYVKAIANGRGEKTSSLSLRRATSSLRQPGSCFKILAAFAPALDMGASTLSTVYYDAPYTVGTKKINNWWGNRYTGYSNIRQGVIYSMNVVATKVLMEVVSPQIGYEYVENFGITSLVEARALADGTVLTDIGAALALGGLTDGVSNLEITAAYAAIANGGLYVEPLLYTKIVDNTGRVLVDKVEKQQSRQVIKETTAFLLTSAMEDSCDYNKYFDFGITSTSTKARLDGMATAGKSGTTSDNNDLWFVGYTPYFTAGCWEGYDVNDYIAEKDGSQKVIWKNVMTRVHAEEGLEKTNFKVPAGLETRTVCVKCGKLAITDVCELDRGGMVQSEYFVEGSAPTKSCDCHVKVTVCKESGQLASVHCPKDSVEEKVFMVVNAPTKDKTYDTDRSMPDELKTGTCTTHTEWWSALQPEEGGILDTVLDALIPGRD
ncbi:MAG: transglycosylase domain-containing protein, partial [Lachnospiraceae bacterium]|nr:transglycosylase domain-containing protein [Lachnospiraceae bacterium]